MSSRADKSMVVVSRQEDQIIITPVVGSSVLILLNLQGVITSTCFYS